MPLVPAMVDFQNPLFWAVLIGWILSVVLHEFAHGVVAYWGGDYTIRERGGLSLNPLQYVDPTTSLLMPAIFLAIGGFALPGGVTYVHRELLRSKWWDSAVSLAGPAMNVLLFFAGAIALHPKVGWVTAPTVFDWTPAQLVVATLTSLQLFSAVMNMIPCPPLDGFGAIGPFLKPETREKLTTPPTSTGLMVVLFVVLFASPAVWQHINAVTQASLEAIGYDETEAASVTQAIYFTIKGR